MFEALKGYPLVRTVASLISIVALAFLAVFTFVMRNIRVTILEPIFEIAAVEFTVMIVGIVATFIMIVKYRKDTLAVLGSIMALPAMGFFAVAFYIMTVGAHVYEFSYANLPKTGVGLVSMALPMWQASALFITFVVGLFVNVVILIGAWNKWSLTPL